MIHLFGSMSEWLKVSHLKCDASQGAVGSNPTTSAKYLERGLDGKAAVC